MQGSGSLKHKGLVEPGEQQYRYILVPVVYDEGSCARC